MCGVGQGWNTDAIDLCVVWDKAGTLMLSCALLVDTCVVFRSNVHKDCLPLLRLVAERGNVMVFEWQTGKRPSRVDAAEMDLGSCDEEDDDASDKDADAGEVSGVCFIVVASSATGLLKERILLPSLPV